ncbi:hypothetical protein D043_3021B, partial [Vibrio parahaemolyticus EKP-021]
WMAMAVSTN